MAKKSNTALKYISHIAGKTKLNVFFLTFIQTALGVSSVLYALMLKKIINAAVSGEKNDFFIAIVEFIGLFLTQIILKALNRWLEELTKSTLENNFKKQLFSVLLNRDFSAVSCVHSGEWINRLTSDTTVIANNLTSVIPGVFGMAVKIIGAVIMIIALEPRFSYLILPCGILLLLFSTLFRKQIKKLHKKVQEKDGILRIYLQDILGSMLMIRSFAIENEAVENAEKKMQEHKAARMKKNRFSNFCNIGFGFVMNGAYVVGAVFCGYGILMQTMSYGDFMAVLQLINQVQSPFANISSFLPQWYAMIASAERLIEAENFEIQNNNDALSLNDVLELYKNNLTAIELKNAGFTYRSIEKNTVMPVVLHDISLTINKGEYVAFTGHSGCGKSTVMKLLLSLYKLDIGEKFVVCKNEKQPLDTKWQRLFAYVPQGNHLMSGTIRDVITISDSSRKNDDAAIENALKIACANDFVNELEKGTDTLLGERGQGLSEGQMQRIAVARAIFSGSPILLLDESTSALDEQTEQQLLSNLRSMTDKTVVIVTHRPAALDICDKIIEFTENGLTEMIKNDRDRT